MTWLMENLKIYLQEQLLTKYCVIKHLIFAKNPKYDGYQRGLASMVCKCFDKKTSGGAIKTLSEIVSNQGLAKELHKPIKKRQKRVLQLLRVRNIR